MRVISKHYVDLAIVAREQELKIRGGYYIKARCVQESEIAIAPPHVREIWDWFLMKANHSSEKKFGHVLEKGQLLCTYAEIQEGLHWMVGWRKQTYSKSDCETAMKWLKKRGNVTTRKTTRGMIVTICNYEHFQNPKNYENHKGRGSKPTVQLQPDDTIDKKLRIEEERKDKYRRFSEKFWELFPKRKGRKVGKPDCLEYINDKIQEIDFQPLLKATTHYSKSSEVKSGYVKNPLGFLKKDYWRAWIEPEIAEPEEMTSRELHDIEHIKREQKAKALKAKIMAERNMI